MKAIRHLSAFMAVALSLVNASAHQLSPQEALAAANNYQSGSCLRKAGSLNMQLSMTTTTDNLNTLYVFTPTGESKGFVVVAADDAVSTPVLGYSDGSDFDSQNIPPQMQWWLDAASNYVAAVSQNPDAQAPQRRRVGESRQAIAPLVQTQWNQDAPYNDLTPIIDGKHTYTGCVATAMAQVMKYHEYPAQGVGSYSYTFRQNGADYTVSADFGATTYAWNEMLDNYDSNATEAQNNAVATLMMNCGVASQMKYGLDASGTTDILAGTGMIKYFDYDKSLQYNDRAWYTQEAWEEMIFDELEAGRPVMYGGCNKDNEGHEFVCDGYSAEGLFHINWGWGGLADGYFDLAVLDPESQGIGGGNGSSGFKYFQSTLTHIMPDQGNSYAPSIYMESKLQTNNTTYTRDSNTEIAFMGAFFSMALGNISDYYFGYWCIGNGVDEFIVNYRNVHLASLTGTASLYAMASQFPVGEYSVYPIYRTTDTDWQLMHYAVESNPGHVNFAVTENSITVAPGTIGALPGADVAVTSIETPTISETDAPVEYFDIYGMRVENPQHGGIYIQRQGDSVRKIVI